MDNALVSLAIDQNKLLTHFKFLSSDELAGRKIGSQGNEKASEYIKEQLIASGVNPIQNKYQHPFVFTNLSGSKSGRNIIGKVKGTHYPQQYIVVSAHFDHLGSRGIKIFNGADDNASGASALLVIAENIAKSPLRHSVIFLFTDAEESGLKGARAFVDDYEQLITSIKLNINIDMIAGSNKTRTLRFLHHDIDSIMTVDMLNQFNKTQQNALIHMHHGFRTAQIGGFNAYGRKNWKMASDHGAFYLRDIPFIYYGVGTHKNYHSENDIFENANTSFFIKATDTIYKQILFIDDNI